MDGEFLIPLFSRYVAVMQVAGLNEDIVFVQNCLVRGRIQFESMIPDCNVNLYK